MTLGCGGWGGNITSDNISPRHLLNIKRLAYELRPAVASPAKSAREHAPVVRLPKAPAPPVSTGIPAQALSARVDAFLSSRGFRPGESSPPTHRWTRRQNRFRPITQRTSSAKTMSGRR